MTEIKRFLGPHTEYNLLPDWVQRELMCRDLMLKAPFISLFILTLHMLELHTLQNCETGTYPGIQLLTR